MIGVVRNVYEKYGFEPLETPSFENIETLLGKLCLRLARLPGVRGVRVQVTKLEVFDDCHVAMSAEHGEW